MDQADERGQELERLLAQGVETGVFPGAIASVGQLAGSKAPRIHRWAGLLEPGGEPVKADTPYDLASLTKPVVSMAGLRLSQRGVVDLHVPIARWLPSIAGSAGGDATLAELLCHRAGLSAWGQLYEECRFVFGSDAMKACMLHEASQRRAEEVPEGSRPPAIYSDLGYLLAGEALASAADCELSDLVEREVTGPLGLAGEIYYAASLPSRVRAQLVARVAPTEFDPWRGRLLRGEVHDENCAAFGGVAGHAGLFGTSRAVLELGLCVLDVLAGRSDWIDGRLLAWALSPRPGGSHVVGWDTKSEEGSSAGGRFSRRSFGHLGFTGTSIWCDPARELCAVLLCNRVHPSRDNAAIRQFRPAFHDAVVDLWYRHPNA